MRVREGTGNIVRQDAVRGGVPGARLLVVLTACGFKPHTHIHMQGRTNPHLSFSPFSWLRGLFACAALLSRGASH